jgi:hypothetical protein
MHGFFDAIAIFHAFNTAILATFSLFGVGFSVFKQARMKLIFNNPG